MENEIIYRGIRPGEENEACLMVADCFNEFVAPGYADVGIMEFLKYIVPDSMQARLAQGDFIMVALTQEIIAGVMEVHSNNYISLLFVKKEYQRRGIAKKLLELAITRCRQTEGKSSYIEANSSPFAVPIYEKLGFVIANTEQEINGIRFTPMMLKLSLGVVR